MKKIIYGLLMCLSMVSFAGCEDKTHDDSRVTYYATLELKGDDLMFWDKGTPFVDPGYVSEMKGEDVTDQVTVSGTVDSNTAGIYDLTYTVVNADGYAVSASRRVLVADTTPSPIANGYWNTTATSYRVNAAGTVTTYGKSYAIAFFQVAPGEFYCGDFLGGYYAQRAGYGDAYAMVGHFKLNADNTITLIDSKIAGWGDTLVGMTDGKFDPATGSISWCAKYVSSMDFFVTLTK